jgi:hypothetical protein
VWPDFSAVVCRSDLQALDADWPQYGGAEDRKPCTHEESEDVFAIVIDGGDTRDEGKYGQGESEGVEEVNITDEIAVAYWGG